MPQLLSTRARVVTVVFVLSTIAAVTACVTSCAVLAASGASGSRPLVLESAALLVFAAAALRVITSSGPDALLAAFDQADTELISRTPVRGGSLVIGRVWIRTMISQLVLVSGSTAALAAAGALVGVPCAEIAPLIAAALAWLASCGLTMCISACQFSLVVRLPPIWVGPGLFGMGIAVPVLLCLATALALPVVSAAVQGAGSLAALHSRLIGSNEVQALLSFARGDALAVFAAVAPLSLFLSYVGVGAVVPRNLHWVRARLRGGHHWRTNKTFSGSLSAVTADKDLRLLFRRGLPAWQTIDGIVFMFPTLIAIALAGNAAGQAFNLPVFGLLATLANASAIIVVMGMSSESLTAVLTSDADGATLRLFRWQPGSFQRYLAAKSATASALLAAVGLCAVAAVHAAAPWPGGSLIGIGAGVLIAAVAEGICVVVGSAHRPALFRKDLGTADLEPSVRLVSGVLSAITITVIGPFIVLTTGWGTVSPIVSWAVLAAVIPAAYVAAARLAPRIYWNLKRGDAHAVSPRCGGSNGSA